MKTRTKNMNLVLITALSIIIFLSSCRTILETEKIINKKSSFLVTAKVVDNETGLCKNQTEVLKVGSSKWKKLFDFITHNDKGWITTPASYIGDICVKQGNFTLIYILNSKIIVISFIDKEGNSRQYLKSIEVDELNFLFKK